MCIFGEKGDRVMQLNECVWYLGSDPNQERLRRANWQRDPYLCFNLVSELLPKNLRTECAKLLQKWSSQ